MSIPLSLTPGLRRGGAARSAPPGTLVPLRAPLLVKVVGANAGVLAAFALFTVLAPAGWGAPALAMAALVAVAIDVVLVTLALRPVRELEQAAARVWQGDLAARVTASPLADRQVLRVGAMFNLLLDSLSSERERMRLLASEIVTAGDRERAALARELHDSTAQRLAAVQFHLGAAARDCTDPVLAERLAHVRDGLGEALDEVRTLAHTVHPRVLDDLGLPAALQKLARESMGATSPRIEVVTPPPPPVLSPLGASILYRIAQEAVRNATRHAGARTINIRLWAENGTGRLEVRDDGRGFDVAAARSRRAGMGLFTMQERVALVDGEFEVYSSPADGTTVRAAIPISSDGHQTGGTP